MAQDHVDGPPPGKKQCTPKTTTTVQKTGPPPLRFASICSSNMNRSMEAHLQLQKSGMHVESYGTGSHVKLPGPTADRPNVYDFGTPYADILADLKGKDGDLYVHNGVLNMLERNVRIKRAPQPWKSAMDSAFAATGTAQLDSYDRVEGQFDVILTFEERVFDAVFEGFQERECSEFTEQAVHCINVEVRDSHDEALLGAQDALALCRELAAATDLDDQVGGILERWAEGGSGARSADGTSRLKAFMHTFFY
jgi:RNA polymerase II subunit A C-terminal domain phosphatase SSU72